MALQQSRCHGAAAWTAAPLGAGPGGGPALDSDATEVAGPAQHLDTPLRLPAQDPQSSSQLPGH